MTKNKVKHDIGELKKAAKNDQNFEGSNVEGQKIDTGETVFFTNFSRLHVAQGFTDDAMYITVPLWYNREIRDKKTGELLYTRKALTNFVVLSTHEIIKPGDSYFQKKNIVAELPEMTLDERWSMDSILSFYNNKATVEPRAVYSKLREIWKYYMDLSGNQGAYTALPLINTLSYCQWLFQYAPYLKYEGEKGASKSKGCEMHEYIDFNAFSGVDFTPAVIFRTLQDTRGTLVIDEAETYDKLKNKSEYEQAREGIINAGFKANGKVSRMERVDNHFSRVDFHVYGIKIIGSIHGVSETIRDRSYQIMLSKTLNKEISGRTPRLRDSIFQEARDMLYLLVLNYWKEIKDIEQTGNLENRLGLIGREWDKAKPLLVLATFYARHDPEHGKDIIDELWQFLTDQKNREIALTLDTFDEIVINQVEQAIQRTARDEGIPQATDHDFTIRLSDISIAVAELEGKRESKGFNLRRYSRMMKAKIEKLALGSDFRHGTDNITVFTSNAQRIQNARERYGITTSSEINQDVINLINSDNLINSINLFNSHLELIKINQKQNPEKLINSMLTAETTASLMKGINELIKLITGTSIKNSIELNDVDDKPSNSDVQNEQNDLKKVIFNLVKSENRSMKRKEIHDMIPEHKIDLPKIYELCEELTHEGSFVKNEDCSYSTNPNNERLPGNVVKGISEEEGQHLINSLMEEGIPVRVNDSGKSYDDRSFKIAVEKSYYSKHKETVDTKMASHGFTKSNHGEFDSIFFIQPLKVAASQ